MKIRRPAFIGLAALFAAALCGRLHSAQRAAGAEGISSLQNEALSLQLKGPDLLRLTNKLSGRTYDISAASFELLLEIGGRTFPAAWSSFVRSSVVGPSPDLLRVRYEGTGELAGLAVEVEYSLAPSYPYHNYEWNSGAPELAGMTFRLPIERTWKGKTVEFRVMMFGDGADGARAELRLVTPKPAFAPVTLRVGPPERPDRE